MNYLQNRWLVYIRDRFPILTFGALSAGIAFSGLSLEERAIHFLPFMICFIGIMLLFGLQRLMDDVKSLEKDKIAYPERPLPRQVIAKDEVLRTVSVFHKALFIYSILVWVTVNALAALIYAAAAAYLWWQYRDIYARRWLLQRPFLGGLFRHLGLFLLVFFAAAAGNPTGFLNPPIWAFAAMVAASFFCYDICGKLNPHIHPVLGTYVHFYGFRRAFEVAAMTLVVSAICAIFLGLDGLLVPCEVVVLASMTALFWQPAWFRLPEVTASISLMVHVWAPAIFRSFHG